jgi:hypothetical protein
MLQEDGIHCDSCGQKLPPSAKLAQQTMSVEEARAWGSSTAPDPDGTVTVDICLACRIRKAQAR